MQSSRRLAYVRLGARIALLVAALILGIIAYTSSNLPALGGALLAAALGLRPLDYSLLRPPIRKETPVALPAENGTVTTNEGLSTEDSDKPPEVADVKGLMVGIWRERPLLALGLPAIVLAAVSAATE